MIRARILEKIKTCLDVRILLLCPEGKRNPNSALVESKQKAIYIAPYQGRQQYNVLAH